MPPTLGAGRRGWRRPQLAVDALLVDDELVDELPEEDPLDELEEPDEALVPFAPAGVEELVLPEDPESVRESLR